MRRVSAAATGSFELGEIRKSAARGFAQLVLLGTFKTMLAKFRDDRVPPISGCTGSGEGIDPAKLVFGVAFNRPDRLDD